MGECTVIAVSGDWELLECKYNYKIRSRVNHRNSIYLVSKQHALDVLKLIVEILERG